jgi:MFS family permease
MVTAMFERARNTWNEYPKQFWVLFFGSLLNSTGGGLIYPFFSLYLTRRLQFTMTEVGVIFTMFAVTSVISQVVGGILVDRWGRKPVMLVSMLGEAAGSLLLGLTTLTDLSQGWARWSMVAVVVLIFGLTNSAFGPAVNAMMADLIDGPKRLRAYGLIRVVQNLGVSIGPAIGGIIINISYLALFGVAATASAVYMVIIALLIRETRPLAGQANQPAVSSQSQRYGLRMVLGDKVFLAFCFLLILIQIVYSQMESTLPVYLNKSYGVTEQWYGLLMSTNAVVVVLFQFAITRKTAQYDKSVMMAVGSLFFAVGFGMFGFVSILPLFFLAQVIWTIGEMITIPVGQAFVADIAPEAMRGRYMGFYGVAFSIGFGVGPLLGGAIMDGIGGQYIWYGAFILSLLVVGGFLALKRFFRPRGASGQV